ncbi:hypothetical protein Z042_22835 [Chania multitudinisentens RB-25]|uniref:Fimbrial-type adhesion domain-containing protein n=1 Tax=Chania multitudinisentens RB-25 TaxID=1441930 RepID=W0LJG9_9GAMM|nr:fimbrial protein [Chania multitudinisentens]AHG22145.1 hypothetical protein Z042_22835 [Chania multitudinisentens RB-25]
MKKTSIVLMLLINGIIITPAFSADGTLTFNAKVYESACEIELSQSVQLADMPTGMLLNVNTVPGTYQDFEIELKNCPQQTPQARIKLEGTAAKGNSSAFSLDEPDAVATAKGLGLYIQGSGGRITPNQTSGNYTLDTTPGNINKLKFSAAYVVTGAVQTGTANVTTQFTVIYP